MSEDPIQAPEAGHFQPSYRVSRDQLLDHARALTPRFQFLTDSRLVEGEGPEGETLSLDWLMFGARKPKHVLVVSSGTHGVEGFCGSAIQHQMLAEQLPNIELGADTAIVVQHANNPYGFAWLRRVTEANVDINRNFRESFDTEAVSADYETLYDALNPTDMNADNEAMRWAVLGRFLQDHGLRRTQQAVTEGQYKFPEGMQFGGHAPEPCVVHLQDLVREHLSAAQTVYWIDLHTGLGEFGECELICSFEPDHPNYQTAEQVWPERVQSSNTGDSVSTPLHGMMDQGLTALMPADCDVGFVVAEFGTYPVDRMLRAMRGDNWLHQHGPKDLLGDPVAREVKAEMLEAFRPDRAQWRIKVLDTGRELIDAALQSLPGATVRSESPAGAES